ncbi:MAG: hypothetical protein JWO69_58 [Thermoleophilia bacterium]|jgi:hypothetical protein|nr:hypothetical protein [Thermoleophilia bacterium]
MFQVGADLSGHPAATGAQAVRNGEFVLSVVQPGDLPDVIVGGKLRDLARLPFEARAAFDAGVLLGVTNELRGR